MLITHPGKNFIEKVDYWQSFENASLKKKTIINQAEPFSQIATWKTCVKVVTPSSCSALTNVSSLARTRTGPKGSAKKSSLSLNTTTTLESHFRFGQ